jgi:outer membrane lipoprotein carrier protein
VIEFRIKKQTRRRATGFISGFALLLFSWATAAFAQTPTALELAKRVDDHYNHLQSLKAGFSEQYEGLGMKRSEAGTMLLRKPGRMRWEYTSTPGKVFVLDGKYAWFYSPGASQVQRIAASQLDDLRSPLRFLLGHTKIESELEGLKVEMYEQMGRAGLYMLSGVPKGQQKRISKLSLSVSPDGVIHGIVIEEIDGSQTKFLFNNEESNAVIPEGVFRFTPPVGVPVVDSLPPV